jgi:hypothetical protein
VFGVFQPSLDHWKQSSINLDALLTLAQKPHKNTGTYQTKTQDHELTSQLDNALIEQAKNQKEGTLGWVNMGNGLTRELVFLSLPTTRWHIIVSSSIGVSTLLFSIHIP